MKRRALFVVIATACALGIAEPAQGAIIRCPIHTDGPVDKSAFPVFYRLRAINLPKAIDGVASPCVVAETIAGLIQSGFTDNQHFPGVVHPTGFSDDGQTEWEAKRWACTYKTKQGVDDPYEVGSCRRYGYQWRVTMELAS